VSSNTVSYIVCAVYQPGSSTVSAAFYTDLADVLVEPLLVVGDLNVHLERSTDSPAIELVDLVADYGLSCRVATPTHVLGGLLDVSFLATICLYRQ